MTLAVALAEIAALKARVDALESGRATSAGGADRGSGSGGGDALPDRMLDASWADATIDKDPPKWKGRSQVGRRYSLAPVDWLESTAGFFEWKAQRGREETPVRLQSTGKNAGKPWHEADTFKAKLLRAWARRNAAKSKPSSSSSGAAPTAPATPDDEFSFGANAPSGPDDELPF